MENIRLLFVSFLSAVLIVSSPVVLAQSQLIEGVPEIYYLEELEDGENFRVTACYGALMASNCDTVVEVSLADLEFFTSQLNREVDSVDLASNEFKELLGVLGAVIFGAGTVVGSIVTIGDIFPKNRPRSPRQILRGIGLTIIIASGFIVSVNSANNAANNLNNYARNETLLRQLRQRLVDGENNKDRLSNREERRLEILERFTDFLNQHGREMLES